METVDILGRKWQINCMGCSIANGEMEVPGGIIYETENFIVHQDPNNPIPGFMIIGPKRHIKNISQFTQDEMNEFSQILYKTRYALSSFEDIDYCTLIQEEHSPHFHLWLLPKYNWMENVCIDGLNSVIPMLKYSKENWKTEKMITKILETARAIKELLGK
ncbi:MAG: HIT domain-containing protein [Treponema sp.]|jgi:diadenosine tetraphosphate (Ap4A) HIT family hydrolase|nr:HIT domain-containing protein [Treponema sp.]